MFGDGLSRLLADFVLVGGAAAALFALSRLFYVVYRIARRVELTWSLVEQELSPNGGYSLKDQIGRIDVLLEAHDLRLQRVEERLQG